MASTTHETAAADTAGSAMASRMADTSLQIILHPLVILNISDYITRHTLRGMEGPVVGGIMGHNNGRQITLAHAFELKVDPNPSSKIWQLDKEWLEARTEQSMCGPCDRVASFSTQNLAT
jgi:COP9 signalosome complex subunit 6